MESNGWTILVRNYLPVDDRMVDRITRVVAEIDELPDAAMQTDPDARTITIDYSHVEGWRDRLKDRVGVLRAGRNFVVCPPWHTYDPADGDIVLHIDPGIAFGSGLHESTRLCLSILEDIIVPGGTAIDFGAGSGILAIAAAKIGASRVVAIEADEESASVAAENIKRNQVDHIVATIHAADPEAAQTTAGIITANITPKVIGQNLPGLVSVLRPGGAIVMSGMTVRNYHEVEDILPQSGLMLTGKRGDGEWIALVATKP